MSCFRINISHHCGEITGHMTEAGFFDIMVFLRGSADEY